MENDNTNTNHDNVSVQTLSGGGVRVAFGVTPADSAPPAVPEAFRTGNQSYRWTAGGGMEQSGVTRWQHSTAGTEGGSAAATLALEGGKWTVETVPGMPGSRTDLITAQRMGIIERDAAGNWRDKQAPGVVQLPGEQSGQPAQLPGQQGPTDTNQPQEQAPELEGVFDPEEDAAWRAEFADVPEHAFRAAMAGVVKAVTLGHDLEAAAATLARDTGMDPAAAAEKVENGLWAQRQIVDRALAKVGMPADQLDAFYEATRDHPNRLQDAISHLLHGRDVQRWQTWGREWLAKKGAA